MAKRNAHPYAHIDWNKAASLFTHVQPPQDHSSVYPRVSDVLLFLMKAGAEGLTFVFDAHKRGVAALHPGFDPDWRMKQVMRQLEKQHCVQITDNADGKTTVKVLKKGRVRALTYALSTLSIQPQKWDGKWRVVIFDIPTKYNKMRNIFRVRLVQLGMHQLQESVYVSPYPCFDEVEFLRELYGVAFTVRYLLATQIEEDSALRRHFALPL